ncbi:MAG: hypothetical protein KDH88_03080 [Chromatiales bacterium]|nr:hypothetical protein [Chromatiales bacterium]
MGDRLAAWARTAGEIEFGFAVSVLMALAVAALYLGTRRFHWYRLIQDTPTSRIRSAAQGYVELQGVGKHMDGPPIVSPLSNQPCVWYRYRVERRQRSGNARNWSTAEAGSSDSLFLIDDGSGHCVVNPDGAQVVPALSRTWYGDSARPMEPPSWSPMFGGWTHGYRYREELIPLGSRLYAMGHFRTLGGSADEFSMAEDIRELLRAWKRDMPALLRRYDSNNDGTLDLREWEKVRAQARGQVLAERFEQARKPGINTLSDPGDEAYPFLLAGISENVLVKRYRAHVLLGICGFFVLGGLAAYLLSVRIGT